MHEKDLSLLRLYDFYSGLLSGQAREQFEMYYQNDLSLSEISELTGISRQGVRSNLKHAESQLREFEETMRLAERADAADRLAEQTKRLILAGETENAVSSLDRIKELF